MNRKSASSPISEAITAPNMNIEFKIRNNKVDQPQSMSAKMAANGIRRNGEWEII